MKTWGLILMMVLALLVLAVIPVTAQQGPEVTAQPEGTPGPTEVGAIMPGPMPPMPPEGTPVPAPPVPPEVVVTVEPGPDWSELVLVAVIGVLALLAWASGPKMLQKVADSLLDATPPWLDDIIRDSVKRSLAELEDRAAATSPTWDDVAVAEIVQRVLAALGEREAAPAPAAGHEWDAG